MSDRHKNATPGLGIHVLPRYAFDDIAARDAFTYSTRDDGGCVQVGAAAPYAYYILTDSTGPTFVAFGGAAAAVWSVVTEAAASRAAAGGEFILIAASVCAITLPSPADNDRVAIKAITPTPDDITVLTHAGGVTIDGTDYSSTGLVLTTQYEQISLISDGTDWFIY